MSSAEEFSNYKVSYQNKDHIEHFDLKCNNSLIENNETKPDTISNKISYFYLCGLCISILLHILDIGTDVYLAYQYYIFDQKIYFLLTLSFVLFPSLINTMISLRMYADDKEAVSRKKRIFRYLMLTFQFAPVVRYIEVLQYAIRLKRNKQENNEKNYEKYYLPLLREDSNLSLLRVIECFLEAAPQQVLQLAILFHMEQQNVNYFLQVYQYMTISTSLVSIAWSFAIYNRSIRFARDEKRKMSWVGSFVQLTWLFSITSARILSISEVASIFPKIALLGCIIHWLIMTLWLSIFERTWFCYSSAENAHCKIRRIMEVLFCAVLGLVFIFAFITFKDGDTKYKYIFYYTVCFVENMTAIFLWSTYNHTILINFWWYIPVMVTTYLLFFIGIISMVVYYTHFHPEIGSKNRTNVLPCTTAKEDDAKSNIFHSCEKINVEVQADEFISPQSLT